MQDAINQSTNGKHTPITTGPVPFVPGPCTWTALRPWALSPVRPKHRAEGLRVQDQVPKDQGLVALRPWALSPVRPKHRAEGSRIQDKCPDAPTTATCPACASASEWTAKPPQRTRNDASQDTTTDLWGTTSILQMLCRVPALCIRLLAQVESRLDYEKRLGRDPVPVGRENQA